MRISRRLRGFTLVEVLVAAGLLAIAAAVGHIALVQTLRAQEQTAAALAELASMQTAIARLDRDFTAIAVRGVRSSAGFATAPFVADAEKLEFTSAVLLPEDGENPRSHLERIRYRFEAGGMVRERWLVLDRAGDSVPVGTRILEAAANGTWRYMNGEREWVSRWPDGNDAVVPRAVELVVSLGERGVLRRIWRLKG